MKLLVRLAGYGMVALLALPLIVLVTTSFTPNRYQFGETASSTFSLLNYSRTIEELDVLSKIAVTAAVSIAVSLVALALTSEMLWRLEARKRQQRNRVGSMLLLLSRSVPTVAVCAPIFILSRLFGGQSIIFYILMMAILLTPLLLWLLLPSFGAFNAQFGDLLVNLGPGRSIRFLFFYLPAAGALPLLSIAVIMISVWNEGFLASALGLETLTPTIPSLLSHRGTDWGGIAALGVLSALPGLILTFIISMLRGVDRFSDSAPRR